MSPTAEDHILECALLYERLPNGGRVVLLSNDVAIKIKAMAEGKKCENAEIACQRECSRGEDYRLIKLTIFDYSSRKEIDVMVECKGQDAARF
ncbi:hypothetical protein SUGI_0660640 [Cryptomeria japonica]|nr:hypothetical protein SUGI_0660640 [Cryptomeria japonica]